MNFYNLCSIVAANKKPISMRETTPSFGVAAARNVPYIEPTFNKIEFQQEKPTVILVSAVGATGKTTLAQVLSHNTSLPLLDLSAHKPVGDNTLTGLLTTAYRVEDLSKVFEGIGQGTFGVIIDGIDEGRSKTTEKGFEAFLDDIARLCAASPTTSFVLLGRTQTLEEAWFYLMDKGIPTGLITISPFDVESARNYIDAFAHGTESSHSAEYRQVRDTILGMLSAAFTDSMPDGEKSFLSFIGYPPVLDAIVTLLREEQNYYRLSGELNAAGVNDLEIELLHRISSYILRREKNQKVVPNILSPLVADMAIKDQERITRAAFEVEEQCMRLVAHCLSRNVAPGWIDEPVIDEKYEAHLVTFLPEHPFITDRKFRSAVFEAVALGTLIMSGREDAVQLALDYADSHKSNYHLVYILHQMAHGNAIPISVLRVLLSAAQEFRSRTASVEISVEGPAQEEHGSASPAGRDVEIQIEISMGADGAQSRGFDFQSVLEPGMPVRLGHRLSSIYVTLPCSVLIEGPNEIEIVAPAEICAPSIALQSPALILRPAGASATPKHVVLEADALESTVGKIASNGIDLVLSVTDRSGLTYPAIQYVEDKKASFRDPLLKEKYLRLRRILVHFRSHSKGALAKYRHKIEHERVLRNALGENILKRCLKDKILRLEGSFYYLEPDAVHMHLGISYDDLSKGRTSDKLVQFLQSIN
jgi:hypothetical protein